MNIAFLCVLIACALPYAFIVLAKSAGARAQGGFNNNAPRLWLTRLEGWPARAYWAHQNSWEALPVFLAGVFAATLAHVPQATIDAWAVVFVIARVLYGACYIADLASLRSLVWLVGLASCLRLLIAAI